MMDPNSAHEIPEFLLKRFFNEEPGRSAQGSLSRSFCEPLSIEELLDLEPDARRDWEAMVLSYPELHGSSTLRELIACGYRGLSAHHVLVFNGADGALSLLFLVLAEPGDQIIVQAPNYQPLVTRTGVLLAPSTLFHYGDSHMRIGLGLRNLPTLLGKVEKYWL